MKKKLEMLRDTIIDGQVVPAGKKADVDEKDIAMLVRTGKAKDPSRQTKKSPPPTPETAKVDPGEKAVTRGKGGEKHDEEK